MHPTKYFRCFWADCAPVADLFESREAAKQAAAAGGDSAAKASLYPAHLTPTALDTALASGSVLQVLSVTHGQFCSVLISVLPASQLSDDA